MYQSIFSYPICCFCAYYSAKTGDIAPSLIANLCLFGIPICIITYCQCTLNPMDDDFFILEEMRRYIKSFLVFVIVAASSIAITLTVTSVNNWHDTSLELESIAVAEIVTCTSCSVSLLYNVYSSTHWVLFKLDELLKNMGSSEHSSSNNTSQNSSKSKQKSQTSLDEFQRFNQSTSSILNPVGTRPVATSLSIDLNAIAPDSNTVPSPTDMQRDRIQKLQAKLRKVTISKIFNDKRALTLFFQHLSNEFSLEIGTFFVCIYLTLFVIALHIYIYIINLNDNNTKWTGISMIEFIQYVRYVAKIFKLKRQKHGPNSTTTNNGAETGTNEDNAASSKNQSRNKRVRALTLEMISERNARTFTPTVGSSKEQSLNLNAFNNHQNANSSAHTPVPPTPPSQASPRAEHAQVQLPVTNIINNDIVETECIDANEVKSNEGDGYNTMNPDMREDAFKTNEIEIHADEDEIERSKNVAWGLIEKFVFFKKMPYSEIIEKFEISKRRTNKQSAAKILSSIKVKNGKLLINGNDTISAAETDANEDNRQETVDSYEKNILICKLIACELFHKYIAEGRSLFEININWQERERLTSLMGNEQTFLSMSTAQVNETDLFILFVPCIQEMRKLLGYALSRLRAKRETFAELETIVTKNNESISNSLLKKNNGAIK